MPEESFDHQFFSADEFFRTIRYTDKPVVQDTEENKELNEKLRVLGERLREKLGKAPFMIDYDHQWYDDKGNTRTSPAEAKKQWWSAFWLGILTGIILGYIVPWIVKGLLALSTR